MPTPLQKPPFVAPYTQSVSVSLSPLNMQRQSLGSPGRGGLSISTNDAVLKVDDPKRRESSSSTVAADDENKPEKPFRSHSSPENFVHLIPILLLFCFAVLYVFSHNPSPKDLAQFNGFKHEEKLIDSTDIDEIGRVRHQFKEGEVFAIRSLQYLPEEIERGNNPKSPSHRKLGHF